MNFECHITVSIEHAEKAKRIASEHGWKTSAIDGDPVLGAGKHFYLTKHGTNYQKTIGEMMVTSDALLLWRVPVIREKIELIMYDSKTGVGV